MKNTPPAHTSRGEAGRPDTALFDDLGAEALEEVFRHMRLRHFAAGETICRGGEPGESLFVIRRGLVHVLAGEPPMEDTGHGAVVLGRQRPGDVVGEVALLTGEQRSATLVARVPTDLLELRREAFLALAARFPQLLANLAGIVSRRLVARTADTARRHRPEAIAVVAGKGALPRVHDIVAATRMASPRPVAALHFKDDSSTTSQVLAWLEATLRDHGTVITIITPDHATDQAMLLDHMDRVVAVISLDEALTLAESIGSLARQFQLVEIRAAERPSALSGRAVPMCVVRAVPGELQATDVDWLGRHLARTKLGVALGAGGAKGFAHIGVLRTLERAGYAVDLVAGSSIGAWIGAWLALGMNADAIDRLMRERFTPAAAEAVFRHGAVRAGEPSGLDVLTRLALETTGERTFEQLEIPLAVMTADLHGRGPVPITSGPLHEALVAAMTVPGLYAPVMRGSQRLVDAVVLTPVPTEAMIDSGADVTVAVNLLGREALASWPGDNRPTQTRADRAVRDTVLEALELAQIGAAVRQTALANVPITPRFGPGTWREFHLADRYLAAGEEAAAAALPVLQALARPQGMYGHDAADQAP